MNATKGVRVYKICRLQSGMCINVLDSIYNIMSSYCLPFVYLILITWVQVVCLIIYIQSPRTEGVYIRQATSAMV